MTLPPEVIIESFEGDVPAWNTFTPGNVLGSSTSTRSSEAKPNITHLRAILQSE
jgi:hypothetical protein